MSKLYEHKNLSAVAAYLHHAIDTSGKSQRDIARETGFPKPNMLSMLKHDEAKLPLDRVPKLAAAVGADPAHLFRLALEQSWPDTRQVIDEIFGGIVTRHERALLEAVRRATKDRDPEFSETQIGNAVAVLTLGLTRA
ncbi:helix-turn-helix transcriptional regulator [Lichenihabitans psoromatis]|uniref:helix-turn-helix transcriptional regulator n=1 Tax=Lichenihabitans psoromatis TaxID=2528642 RepID=UPI0010359073|nr:helix-turn-helix transcriptional regulator [Lichenihabitans psoromatis]